MDMKIVSVKIEDVIVKDRIRESLGDLSRLEKSIQQYGLLSPIVINKNNILVSGLRRLNACKNLGNTEVSAVITDVEDDIVTLNMECQENLCRKTLTDIEIDKIIKTKKKFVPKELKKRGIFSKILSKTSKLLGKGER